MGIPTGGGAALDVGCGPFSRLAGLGFDSVTGADVSPAYVAALEKTGVKGVVSSADQLPFPDASFRTVWNIGLLHHLPDEVMQGAIREMLRVSGTQGHVVVIDAVMPRSAFLRPFAWITRKLDRGRFMRTQAQLEGLIRACGGEWRFDEFVEFLSQAQQQDVPPGELLLKHVRELSGKQILDDDYSIVEARF